MPICAVSFRSEAKHLVLLRRSSPGLRRGLALSPWKPWLYTRQLAGRLPMSWVRGCGFVTVRGPGIVRAGQHWYGWSSLGKQTQWSLQTRAQTGLHKWYGVDLKTDFMSGNFFSGLSSKLPYRCQRRKHVVQFDWTRPARLVLFWAISGGQCLHHRGSNLSIDLLIMISCNVP